MQFIRANCRDHFSVQDFDFISAVLEPKAKSESKSEKFLSKLLADTETRDIILDDPELLKALLEQQGRLNISAHLFFYIVVRHMLKKNGIEGRDVADYVAEMLTEFSVSDRLRKPLGRGTENFDYMVDLLTALQKSSSSAEFQLRTHMGNYALFLTGLFAKTIEHREKRSMAPNLDFYTSLGQDSYRIASNHRLARDCELSRLLHELSSVFHIVQQSLHAVSDRWFFLHDEKCVSDLFKTLDRENDEV